MESYQFPESRSGLTRKFNCGVDIYLTVNLMPDGQPGELFVKLGKQGSTVSGLVQAWAVTVSAALQRGVPWIDLREKFVDAKFEPSTDEYTSLVDAITQNVDEMAAEIRDRRGPAQLILFSNDGDQPSIESPDLSDQVRFCKEPSGEVLKKLGTREFNCGLDVQLTINQMLDGQLIGIDVKLGEEGTTVSGLMRAWAVAISAALQREVPWVDLREKFLDSRFDPWTDKYTSLVDAVTRNLDEMLAERRGPLKQLFLFGDDGE